MLMSFFPIYLTVCQLLENGSVSVFFTSESSHAVELAPFLLVYADLKWKLFVDSLCLICSFIFYGYILVQPMGLFRQVLHT